MNHIDKNINNNNITLARSHKRCRRSQFERCLRQAAPHDALFSLMPFGVHHLIIFSLMSTTRGATSGTSSLRNSLRRKMSSKSKQEVSLDLFGSTLPVPYL